MRTGKIKIFTSTIMLFILSFSLLFSSPASAIEISQQVEFLSGYHYPYWSDNNGRSYATGGYSYSTNGDYSTATTLYFKSSSNGSLSASAGRFVSLTGTITMTVTSNSQIVSIQANPRQYFAISSANVDCPLIDITDTDYQQYQSGNNTWRLRYNFVTVCRLKQNITSNVAMNLYLNGASASGTDTLAFNPQYLAFWGAVDGYDDTDVINAINRVTTALNTVNSTLNTINGALGTIQNNQSDMLDAQQQANDDANDRYQDEKDTINNATQDAQDEVNNQDFNFAVPNTLDAFFRSFSDSNCIDIPNLASWIHSNETRVCSPWPLVVKNTMTPIVTGVFALVLTAFFIKWLKTNDSGGN